MNHRARYKLFSVAKRVLPGLIVSATILFQGCAQIQSAELLPPEKILADPAELTRLGDQAYSQGRFDQARHLYKTLTASQPQSFAAWFKLGNASLRQGLPDQAERAYLEALKQDSSDPRVWYNLATARLMNARRAILGATENLEDSDPARRLAAQRLSVLNELIFKHFEESAVRTMAFPEAVDKTNAEASSSGSTGKSNPRS